MHKKIILLFTLAFNLNAFAQTNPGLFRYADVSANQIVFIYSNDVWTVPKTGGEAVKLSSPAGVESSPKFSPDGDMIAFTGNYDGNQDLYVMATKGSVPLRLTSHGSPERVVAWQPDGKKILFASARESGRTRFNQFYAISAEGGPAEKLTLPYGEFASYSPDGKKLALTFRTQAFRNWKRYRGGWKADIHTFDLTNNTSENITDLVTTEGNEFPMWHQDDIYFLSDRGPELRMNIWRYDMKNKRSEQVTTFTDYDIHFPSAGPDDIVFEAGGILYLYNFSSKTTKPVSISLVSDKASLKPRLEKVDKYIHHQAISQDGSRVLMEARGEIFSLPAEKGYVKNLTQTDTAAERYPAWSPDGKNIAFWSDRSGEYELWLQPYGQEQAKQLTHYGAGFRYNMFWSPDSKKIAFIDKAMKIQVYDLARDETIQVDQAQYFLHGALENFSCSWSPDGKYFTYSRDLKNRHHAVFIFDYGAKKLHQVPVVSMIQGNQFLILKENISTSEHFNRFRRITAILIILLFTTMQLSLPSLP
jgi:tricorn protease